ncbi:type II toxin-antitoxin system HicB family antitoxin [Rubellimicrobium aerolatum]|uniref:Type II toxin-antitoxin system HicB family antitoxin n=1 Tax=Rubellimicrobium aerolatum TaxID=490979 RepID=A0ABW0SEN7_9RHOB|nr:type II toxin-antitoxin system HicB family antitoxin [Rubellimicrobium aerolatum]MBP1806445.1 antitoxin HicB [Rubellimicrobium aerolatum]
MRYPIDLTPDEDTLLVTCPDLPEVTSFGLDEADALRMAHGAIEEALAGRLVQFGPIPAPGPIGGHSVRVSLQTSLKVQLMWAMAAEEVNRAELARRLGWHRPQVDRLFDPNHATRLDQYEAAFDALGRQIEVQAA